MRYLSLCSGIEAATVAWKPLGWEAVGFAEIEPFPSAVLSHHYPTIKNYGDITKYKEWGIAPGTIDLICGGPPCQAFSIAGAREGMADPRGNLTLTYLALVDHLRPRWIVYENVPGLLSSNGGADFARFIEGLALCGYHCAWRVYDPAQSKGRHRLPQRRRRVFLVGYLGDWKPPATVLFKPQGGSWDIEKGNPQGQNPATSPVASPGAHGTWWDGGQVSQCLDASVAKRQTMPDKNRFPAVLMPIFYDMKQHHNPQPTLNVQLTTMNCSFVRGDTPLVGEQFSLAYAVRRLTVTECLRLQGFPDGYTKIPWRGKPADQCPDGPQYKAIGNSWAVTIARHIGEQIQLWENSNPVTI